MRTAVLGLCVLLAIALPVAAPAVSAAPGVSSVVLDQFDEVSSGLAGLGLPKGTYRELTAKLDAARASAVAGNLGAAVNSLDALLGRLLTNIPLSPLQEQLLGEVELLRSMINFERFFVPIPLVPTVTAPTPLMLSLLEEHLEELVRPASEAMADACVAKLFPAGAGAGTVDFAPTDPTPAGEGGNGAQVNPQVKNDLRDTGKSLLKDMLGIGSGTGGLNFDKPIFSPRCDVDPGKAANATSSSSFVSSINSMGVRCGLASLFFDGATTQLGLSADILDPGGLKDIRVTFDIDFKDITDNWRVSAFGSYSKSGGFLFGVGFRIPI